MKFRCRTNLDGFEHTTWPTEFAYPPRIGEWVQGTAPGERSKPTLRIVSITHAIEHGEPIVLVELHKVS